jgi:hypothetical protein
MLIGNMRRTVLLIAGILCGCVTLTPWGSRVTRDHLANTHTRLFPRRTAGHSPRMADNDVWFAPLLGLRYQAAA